MLHSEKTEFKGLIRPPFTSSSRSHSWIVSLRLMTRWFIPEPLQDSSYTLIVSAFFSNDFFSHSPTTWRQRSENWNPLEPSHYSTLGQSASDIGLWQEPYDYPVVFNFITLSNCALSPFEDRGLVWFQNWRSAHGTTPSLRLSCCGLLGAKEENRYCFSQALYHCRKDRVLFIDSCTHIGSLRENHVTILFSCFANLRLEHDFWSRHLCREIWRLIPYSLLLRVIKQAVFLVAAESASCWEIFRVVGRGSAVEKSCRTIDWPAVVAWGLNIAPSFARCRVRFSPRKNVAREAWLSVAWILM